MIAKLNLAGYFLIVWDIADFCRKQKSSSRAAAQRRTARFATRSASLPWIQFGMDLLFERFLSEERGEMPDIDLDLSSGGQRERAIQYVYERYGHLEPR